MSCSGWRCFLVRHAPARACHAAGACKRFVWILCDLQCTACCFLAWRVLTCKVQQCAIGVLLLENLQRMLRLLTGLCSGL